MYCKNCGHEISEQAVVCIHCGVATDIMVKKEEYKPITGFILSFFIPIAGLIVSIIEYKKAKAQGGVTTFAFAGIIISIVVLALVVLAVILWFFLLIFLINIFPWEFMMIL